MNIAGWVGGLRVNFSSETAGYHQFNRAVPHGRITGKS